MTTPYEIGRRMEYEAMTRWRMKGYTPVRSAGSHGPWDICAVKDNHVVELIQCKVVERVSTARRYLKAFTSKPFLAPSDLYHQVLEVKVKGVGEIMSITV